MDPITLGIAAGGALIGSIGSAYNRRKAREEKNAYYDYANDVLTSMYYRDPLSRAGNKAILKEIKLNYADNLDAIQNRAIAGGATMENQLAARQANNENLDKVQTKLIQNEDERRDRIDQQKLSLKGQQANDTANGYLQAAQDWQSWGSQMANSALSFGSANLLGGLGSEMSAEDWSKMAPDVSGLMNDMADANIHGIVPPKHPGKTGLVGLAGGLKYK